MDILWTILIGGLCGFIAGQIMRGQGFGIIRNVVIGILGSVIGKYTLSVLNFTAGDGLVGSLATGTIGAIILIVAINLLTGKKS